MKEEWTPLLSSLALLFLILSVASYLCTNVHAAVFFEHLTLGNWIVAHRELPSFYYWVDTKLPWLTHSWLFEVLLSLLETYGGEQALVFFKLGLITALVAALTFAYSKAAKDKTLGVFLAIVVASGLLHKSTLEPRLFVYAAWGLLLHLSFNFRAERKQFLAIFILGLFWANLDAGPLVALLFVALLFRPAKSFIFVFLLSQLFTPYFGAQLLSGPLDLWLSFSSEIIHYRNPANIYSFTLAFLVLLWLFYLLQCHLASSAVKPRHLVLIVFLTLLGLASESLLAYALIVLGFLSAKLWAEAEDRGNLGEAILRLRESLTKIPAVGILWLLLCVLIVNVVRLYKFPVLKAFQPAREVDFILENNLPSPIFHEAALGPYLMYRFSNARGEPQRKIRLSPRVRHLLPGRAVGDLGLGRLSEPALRYVEEGRPALILCRRAGALCSYLEVVGGWSEVDSGVEGGWLLYGGK